MKYKALYRVSLFIMISLLVIGSFVLNKTNKIIHTSNFSNSNSGIKITLHSAGEEDYKKFEEIFEKEISSELPDNSKILIVFYDRDKGYWEADRYYFATKNTLMQSHDRNDVDFKIIMNSRWLTILDKMDFCNVVKNAKANRDFDVELIESKTSLLWKYKSLMSFKECLGF